MKTGQFTVFFTLFVGSFSQRSPYAGLRPIGFPEIETPAVETQNALGNRFGNGTESNVTTTTQRLPVEALGDKELFNRLGKLPIDNQPFWYINWKALEENRKNPQTYHQTPNVFNEIHAQKFFNTPPQNTDNRFNVPQNNVPQNVQQNIPQNNVPQWNQPSTAGHNSPQNTERGPNNIPQSNLPQWNPQSSIGQNNVPQWNQQSTSGFNSPQNTERGPNNSPQWNLESSFEQTNVPQNNIPQNVLQNNFPEVNFEQNPERDSNFEYFWS